jgi:hypothetical protein
MPFGVGRVNACAGPAGTMVIVSSSAFAAMEASGRCIGAIPSRMLVLCVSTYQWDRACEITRPRTLVSRVRGLKGISLALPSVRPVPVQVLDPMRHRLRR